MYFLRAMIPFFLMLLGGMETGWDRTESHDVDIIH